MSRKKAHEKRQDGNSALAPGLSLDEKMFCGFFMVSFFLWGGVYEAISALYSVVCAGFIFARARAQGSLKVPAGSGFYCLLGILLLSLVSAFYAVDWGLALLGFIKFLPVPLFVIAIYQMREQVRDYCIKLLPGICAAMTLLCGILYVTPWRDYFFAAGRMGGLFGYPNVFALIALLSLLILLAKKECGRREIWMGLVCGAGLLLSGSRSVFVLFIGCLIFILVFRKQQRKRAAYLAAAMTAMSLLGLLLGTVWGFGRLATIVSQNSTFWGRLLYWQDALRIIKEHPLGLGYKGYYFAQGRYATGNYVTMFVHNELLQAVLDFGILAGILLVAVVAIAFHSKKISGQKKLLLAVTISHSLFDFDMQFIAMAFFASLLLDFGTAKSFSARIPIKAAVCLVLAVSIYFSLALGLALGNQHAMDLKLYPVLTFSQIEQINASEDIREKKQLVEDILQRNSCCSAIYRLKTGWAAREGDFTAMKEHAQKAIEYEPFNAENYEVYIQGLSLALQNAVLAGDEAATQYYVEQVIDIERQIKKREGEISPLALRIRDKPEIELGKPYLKYIEEIKQIKAKSMERK